MNPDQIAVLPLTSGPLWASYVTTWASVSPSIKWVNDPERSQWGTQNVAV